MSKKEIDEVNLEQLQETFKAMNNEKGQLGLNLLEEITFMQRTLKRMRKQIEKNSLLSEYNGYKRSDPIIAGYNAMINNYSKLTRQLTDLLPKEDAIIDDFDNF